MEWNYKGHKIWARSDGQFTTENDELTAETLKELKEIIDNIKRARIPVLIKRYEGEFCLGEITSVIDERETIAVWLSWKDKNGDIRRGKESLNYGGVYPDTEANRQIADKLTAIANEIKTLEKQRSTLNGSLVRFDKKDLFKEANISKSQQQEI